MKTSTTLTFVYLWTFLSRRSTKLYDRPGNPIVHLRIYMRKMYHYENYEEFMIPTFQIKFKRINFGLVHWLA